MKYLSNHQSGACRFWAYPAIALVLLIHLKPNLAEAAGAVRRTNGELASLINAGNTSTLKREPVAASGRCLMYQTRHDQETKKVLAEYDIRTKGARPEERAALASAVKHIHDLNGGYFSPIATTKFTFADRKGYSRYAGKDHENCGQIQMNRCTSGGKGCKDNNVAHLMHELGHKVGHEHMQGVFAGTYYSNYFKKIKKPCLFSSYAKSSANRGNRNEEFAEVFGAFVTHPEILRYGSPSCKQAYDFFATKVFARGTLATCDKKERESILAALNPAKPTQIAEARPQTPRVEAPSAKPEEIAVASLVDLVSSTSDYFKNDLCPTLGMGDVFSDTTTDLLRIAEALTTNK